MKEEPEGICPETPSVKEESCIVRITIFKNFFLQTTQNFIKKTELFLSITYLEMIETI